MVLQLNKLLIFNVYLLPDSSQWSGVLEKDPCEALAGSLALAYTSGLLVIVLGDLNARIAALLAKYLDPSCTSMDKTVTSRGTWLCGVFNDYNIVFVSSADVFGPGSGKYTSFQGTRRTVIDYVACSRPLFSHIKSFNVADRVNGYDHAALTVQLELDVGTLNRSFERPRKKAKIDVVLPAETPLDRLFITTLAAGKDYEKKLRALYGPVLNTTTPLRAQNVLGSKCTPQHVP
ncbi:hypothetical protein C8F04DRAFT_1198068 [Mycena alexandri]|uniref:Endonuclease/exonuclease/phosphatase domain-containing protein n=1 Tax=Mycena alexandri TaxID=1745969 RepID=A0AAD6WNC4_9AGAR|nr:hypothetical protein C8F04DRAFT_1198068 [Mycena alexandri]